MGTTQAAIAVSGGATVDLGRADSPGGNTVRVSGAGQVLASTGLNFITTAGNTFLVNGAAVSPFARRTISRTSARSCAASKTIPSLIV